MSDKLTIANEMAAFDSKDREFFKNLTDEERKKFSTYLMIRWGSCVSGSEELQNFYIISVNERLNKHFFALSKHPELQWLVATTVSPGLGKFRHNWISPPKKESASSKEEKFLMELFPSMKSADIKLMAKLTDKKDIKKLAVEMGMTVEQVKKSLG